MRDKEVAHLSSRVDDTDRLTIDDLRLTAGGRLSPYHLVTLSPWRGGPRLRFGFGVLGCLGVLAVILCCGGCYSAEHLFAADAPVTKIKLNPIKRQLELENSKDVDVEMSDVTLKHNGTELDIGRLTLTDTASVVREANVGQINASGKAQQAYLEQAGENLSGAIDEFSGLVTDAIKVAAPGGIAGVARERMDMFWYFVLAAGCVFAVLLLWRSRQAK